MRWGFNVQAMFGNWSAAFKITFRAFNEVLYNRRSQSEERNSAFFGILVLRLCVHELQKSVFTRGEQNTALFTQRLKWQNSYTFTTLWQASIYNFWEAFLEVVRCSILTPRQKCHVAITDSVLFMKFWLSL